MSAGKEALELAGFAAAGASLAYVYLVLLAAAARRLVAGRGRAAGGLTALRLALLVGGLTMASFRGAGPLVAMALGLLLARAALLRHIGGFA